MLIQKFTATIYDDGLNYASYARITDGSGNQVMLTPQRSFRRAHQVYKDIESFKRQAWPNEVVIATASDRD